MSHSGYLAACLVPFLETRLTHSHEEAHSTRVKNSLGVNDGFTSIPYVIACFCKAAGRVR